MVKEIESELRADDGVPACEGGPPPTLEEICNGMRAKLLSIELDGRALVANGKVKGESAAQAMLAVRHIEDARMRFGKVIQHTVGNGISCFDSGRPTKDDGR